MFDDIGADAVKIGMLNSSEVISAVKDTLLHYHARNIVLDPVMVATSGDRLIEADAVGALIDELIPVARIITPNIPEAEILSGMKISSQKRSAGRSTPTFLRRQGLRDDEGRASRRG